MNDLTKCNPLLAQQWHPTKNGLLTVSDVTPKSNKEVWWLCDKGHEWKSTVYNRTNGNGCPYCSGRNAIAGKSDLETLNPELAKQWHPTKNGVLTPRDITLNAGKKVWWKCDKGHEWEAIVANRTKGRGCPVCGNRKVQKGFNDLATINPELTKEWHPTKNDKTKPEDVSVSSNKKAWWVCNKGHEWESVIASRTSGVGCPICSNKKILLGYNDLATTNPELAKEWHPTKNGDLTPGDVTAGSDKKVWWCCAKGHKWVATIGSRKTGVGCPKCKGEMQTSFPEQAIYY